MEIFTHQKTDQRLCGVPMEVTPGYSRVMLPATEPMAVDDHALVHGGFIVGWLKPPVRGSEG